MSNPLLPDELQSRAQVRHRIDDSDLPVGQAPEIDWQAGEGITVGVSKNPDRNSMVVNLAATAGASKLPGDVVVGAGAAVNTGYTGLTATTATALDLTQDLVLPTDAGRLFLFVINCEVRAGTGDFFADIESVNQGTTIAPDGLGPGIVGCHVTASTTARLSVVYPYFTTAADIVNGLAVFRFMYRVASGSSTVIGNASDGRFRLTAIDLGTATAIAGQNTGSPPVTPPSSGTVTDRGTTAVALVSSATATVTSGTFNATASNVLVAIAQTFLGSGTTQSLTIADTIGDSGGAKTSWTARYDAQATIGSGSGGLKIWTRTVGGSPLTGKTVTTTRDAGTKSWNGSLTVLELNGWTETPTQTTNPVYTTGNVSSVNLTLTTPGVNDMVVTSLFNPSAAVPVSAAPTIPTTGSGTWVSSDDAIRNDDGHATAYQIGTVASTLNWTGLSPTAGQPIPAGFLVFTPSGSTTAAPGTESWTHADKTSDINQDLTWVARGGTGWQIKSNAAGLKDDATTGDGYYEADYDIGSIHMAIEADFDHFTIPSGTDTVSLSLAARVTDAVAGTAMTCYLCSANRVGDGTTAINFLKVVAGTATKLAGFTATSTPSSQKFRFECSGTNPTILTAKINGAVALGTDGNGVTGQQVTFSETTSSITTGSLGGVHGYRSGTTSDAFWADWAAFAISAPSGGGTGGTTSVLDEPGQGGDNTTVRCSAWKMPRGENCVFDPRRVQPAGANFNISSNNGFGVSVGGAGYPLVDQTLTPANGGEDHYSIYQASGTQADEYYKYRQPTNTNYHHVVTNVKGLGVGVGFVDATEESQLFGLIRLKDLNTNNLHALQIINAATVLSKTHVWPASFQDGYASTNTGFMPYGSLVAIPSDQTIPNFVALGHTAQQAADLTWIWNCLRYFGAYNNDGQGAVGTSTQNLTSLRGEAAAAARLNPLSGGTAGMAAIGAQLRWVTNNTTDSGVTNLGGPGARIKPFKPLV